MSWQDDLIPTKTMQALCRHTVASLFAIGCFGLTGIFASWVFPDKPIIYWIEYIGIALILVFLLYECLREIIKGKSNGENSGQQKSG